MSLPYFIYLSTKRTNRGGKAPVYVKQANGKEQSTGLFIEPRFWHNETKRVGFGCPEAVRINNRLQQIENDLSMDEILGQPKKISPKLTDCIRAFIETQKEKIGAPKPNGILQRTYDYHFYRLKAIETFLTIKKLENIPIHDFDSSLGLGLINFYIKAGYKIGYVNKIVQLIKSTMTYCRDKYQMRITDLMAMQLGNEKYKPKTLTNEQVELIENHKFAVDRLQHVADLFLVQCFTGLSYEDLMRFNHDWVTVDNTGSMFIQYNRVKTDIRGLVPIFEKTKVLFEKYNYKLPRISNVKYNSYLKEVAEIVGIKDNVTTHLGRKTCGSYLLNEGVSIETVSKVLAHGSIKTTERIYAEVLERRMIKEFWNKAGLTISKSA